MDKILLTGVANSDSLVQLLRFRVISCPISPGTAVMARNDIFKQEFTAQLATYYRRLAIIIKLF